MVQTIIVSGPLSGGQINLARRFFRLIGEDLEAANAIADLADTVEAVRQAVARLESLTDHLLAKAADPEEAGAAATDYLRTFALVTYGWLWVKMAAGAEAADGASSKRRYADLARFFVTRLLPQTIALDAAIRAGAEPIVACDTILP